jgi:hypothetical protein
MLKTGSHEETPIVAENAVLAREEKLKNEDCKLKI